MTCKSQRSLHKGLDNSAGTEDKLGEELISCRYGWLNGGGLGHHMRGAINDDALAHLASKLVPPIERSTIQRKRNETEDEGPVTWTFAFLGKGVVAGDEEEHHDT